ncbi:Noc2p family-domain-containing protein [Jimgerdemannia flammicorona]|uniref:Noc2p family-domain-containing protein n=1 Tax=Jimgerdemannia flammicorona TaxID=994334 RepID=A0A433D1E2_9FUNG|nr:Noc2p family-domain-containing protein [Jimgerdemannia flammicorona]
MTARKTSVQPARMGGIQSNPGGRAKRTTRSGVCFDEPVDDEDNDEIEKGTEEIDEKYVFLCNFTFQDMSVDDFFGGGFSLGEGGDGDGDESDDNDVRVEMIDQAEDDDFLALEQVEDEAYSDSDTEMGPATKPKAMPANGKTKKGVKKAEADEDEEDNDEDEGDEKEADEDGDEGEDDDDEDGMHKKPSLKKDISRHKHELEALKARDPEFYKFLQENDQELLEFDVSDDELGSEDDAKAEGSEDEGEGSDDNEALAEAAALAEMEGGGREKESKVVKGYGDAGDPMAVTKEMVAEWQLALDEKRSLRALRRMLLAFRAAARMDDADGKDGAEGFKYKIENAAVFNKLVIASLRSVPPVLMHHLPPRKPGLSPITAPRWKALSPVVRSYLSNVLRLLAGLTENDMILLVVKEAEKCTAFWGCFGKIAREYLKALLHLWSSPSSTDTVRIQAFLNIRTLAETVPATTSSTKSGKSSKQQSSNFLDLCLKATYMTFVRHARNTNAHTLPQIRLMRNLAVELVGVDLAQGYQAGFVYVRQLAIHLRNSMNVKSKFQTDQPRLTLELPQESYKAVYNWQFVHCLDFWTNVLAVYCDPSHNLGAGESPMQPLVYPLVQVALGVVRLIPTAQYFPLRFAVVRSLTALVRRTGVFIPLAPFLFEVLESTEVRRKAKPSTLKPLDWELHLRAPKQYLHGRVYQVGGVGIWGEADDAVDGIAEELYDCLLEYYVCFTTSVAFPELVIPAIVQLKRHVKRSKHIKSNKQLQQLIEKLEQNSRFIEQHRSQVEFSPADQARVQAFLRDTTSEQTPLGAFVRNHRKVREQRRKMVESARDREQEDED